MKIINRIIIVLLLPLSIILLTPGHASAGLFGGDAGKKKIEKLLRAPALSGVTTGIRAVSLNEKKTVLDSNGGKLFIPASNVKLVTAYCALKILTPQYAFPTEFSTDTALASTTVHNLYIRGYGDPTVTLADINLEALGLSDKIRVVTGDIIIDTSYFDGLQFGQGWMWDEGIVPWNAPISPCTVNGNCVDIYVRPAATPGSAGTVRTVPATAYALIVASVTTTADSNTITLRREETGSGDRFIVSGNIPLAPDESKWQCTVSRPGLYTATLFRELLLRYGVKVQGNAVEGPVPPAAVPLERYASRTLGTVVRAFLKDSDNLYGECLLKALGAAVGTPPGNAGKGIAAIETILKDIGIAPKSYRLADGSGLSTYNLFSPAMLTRILEEAYREFSFFPEFSDALSIAGTDGTLRNRFTKSPVTRLFRAKTGTMSGVSCISGYLKTRKGNLLAVSIMMNGCTGPAKPFQDAQDEIIKTFWENY